MGVAIRAADEGDRESVVRLLDAAFQDDPVSGWIFPGAEYRRTTHPRLMAEFTDVVLDEGRIDVTEDGSACWRTSRSVAGGDVPALRGRVPAPRGG